VHIFIEQCMTQRYYAHSLNGMPQDFWQSLDNHLKEVASMAEAFAAKFDSAAWAYTAGILHDLGKAHPDFQSYLHRQNGLNASEYDDEITGSRVNHSGAGAILAYEKWHNIIGKTLAYLVAGHHAGLPDWFDGADSLPMRIKNEQHISEKVRHYARHFIASLPDTLMQPAFAMQCRNHDATAYHMWVRMLYSCLVDADFLNSEAFMDATKHSRRPLFPSLAALKVQFDKKLQALVLDAPKTSVNAARADILKNCRVAAKKAPGLFSLTVPTGGGKTLSGAAFALDHAIHYGKDRIIYVIPYTSIIEQTAGVLREFFGTENVVEHHTNIATEREKESPHLTLAAENWDAPVIVTTSVRFLSHFMQRDRGGVGSFIILSIA
jgi:CRISPR-associated endonuclease/helicase Cas3